VTQVNLPATRHLQLNIHNRDNDTKNAMVSFDQTLIDGGAAPATGAWTIDQYLAYNVNGNGANGMASVTKFFVFSLFPQRRYRRVPAYDEQARELGLVCEGRELSAVMQEGGLLLLRVRFDLVQLDHATP